MTRSATAKQQGEAPKPIIEVGPVNGIDDTTPPLYLDASNVVDMVNYVTNRSPIGLTTGRGRVNLGVTGLYSQPTGMFKWTRPSSLGYSTVILFATTHSGTGRIQWAPYAGGAASEITLPTGPSGSTATWTANRPTFFVPYGEFVFIANDTDRPIKLDLNLMAWWWQITPPLCVQNAPGAGGAQLGSYYYVATLQTAPFVEGTILESGPTLAPSPGNTFNITPSNQTGSTTVHYDAADAQVTTGQINLYRIGGTLAQWLEATNEARSTQPQTVTDGVADSAIIGPALTFHADVPAPITAGMCIHQEHLFQFGPNNTQCAGYIGPYSSTGYSFAVPYTQDPNLLAYSNFAQPWGFDWGDDSFPLGENLAGDLGVIVGSIGSVLLALKQQTMWLLYGSSQADFYPVGPLPFPCASALSLAIGYGTAFWSGGNQGVFMFNGNGPTNISNGNSQQGTIQTFLKSLTAADHAASCGFIHDQMYCLSFPNQNVTYQYDMRVGKWTKLGWATPLAIFDLSVPGGDGGGEVFAVNNTTGTEIDTWYAAETDLGNPITSTMLSPMSDGGQPLATKTFDLGMVETSLQAATIVFTCMSQVTNVGLVSDPVTVYLGTGSPRQLFDIPNSREGFLVQFSTSMQTSQKTQLFKLGVYGGIRRIAVLSG